ncbi:monofunctional biosynthetic peptidoglycan transglycosylase [Zhouia sp. PK063]|uniref:monofunctional biosynthetic peptidoglycan transglycosylase n=1 Tax=Zhouia sp. PK063 TaxID=3373602 RepID=UPI0037B0EC78
MIRKIFRFALKLILWFIGISLFLVIIFKWVPVPFTPLMFIRSIEQKTDGKELVWHHDWVPIEDISKNLQLAVICSEDQNFLNHNGFDMEAIEKVYKKYKQGKTTRGASTISQQTAKNLFLWPSHSWVRKGFEVYFTFLIETFWSKQRILEVYLNSIEMGNGIYGAEAASQYWFHKSAKNLTKYEAAALAAVLPSPLRYKANPASAYIQGRKAWIVQQMGFFGKYPFDDKKKK